MLTPRPSNDRQCAMCGCELHRHEKRICLDCLDYPDEEPDYSEVEDDADE